VPAVTNILFVKMPPQLLQGLLDRGFDFYHGGRWDVGVARLVTSFRTTAEMVDALVLAATDIQR
jgi:threonine aldolase